jgi:hypothetical protein
VWRETGRAALAARSGDLARRLGSALRRAVRKSQVRLRDGSLFVPVRLLDGERPHGSVTESRLGSYWNLVVPYALASGLVEARGADAEAVLRYLARHGSRLLGLVRSGAYSLYGRNPPYPESGINPVYGLNAARFLADNDRPDELVLSLYGQLAAAMSPGTFVAGEAVSVAPLRGERYPTTYLPPNAASNASFLETLRLMLVHEPRDRRGAPRGLELAFATPRAWLEPGRSLAVRDLPTSFGPLSYSIELLARSVRLSIEVPERARGKTVLIRLRLPSGRRISEVAVDGRAFWRFDAGAETIDLTGKAGRHELAVRWTEPRR